MSRDFEYEIRDAVVDLAEEGRSVNLAAPRSATDGTSCAAGAR